MSPRAEATSLSIRYIVLAVRPNLVGNFGSIDWCGRGNVVCSPETRVSSLDAAFKVHVGAQFVVKKLRHYILNLDQPLSGTMVQMQTKVHETFAEMNDVYENATLLDANDTFDSIDEYEFPVKGSAEDKKGEYKLLVVVFLSAPSQQTQPPSADTLTLIRENEDAVRGDAVRKARAFEKSPSDGASLPTYCRLQKGNEGGEAFNYRPPEIHLPSPITIYEPAFARFVAAIESSDHQSPSKEQLHFAFQLVWKSLGMYDVERDRKVAMLELASPYEFINFCGQGVELRGTETFLPDALHRFHSKTFGTWVYPFIFEMNVEIGAGKADPIHQAQLGLQKILTSYEYRKLRRVSCCPAFLVAMAGPVLFIWGSVLADRFYFEPLYQLSLTPLVSVTNGQASMNKCVYQLAKALNALEDGIKELVKYYRSLELPKEVDSAVRSVVSEAHDELIPNVFPRWTKFKIVEEETGRTVEREVQYIRRLPAEFNKPVFLAMLIDNASGHGKELGRVVVKFTARYCPEAHRALEKEELAPKLYFAEFQEASKDDLQAPGMWVVVMDYIEDQMPDDDDDYRFDNEQCDQLRKAVETLHEKGYVFGDLRIPNILVTKEKRVNIVDFDWCGKKGEVFYPASVNMDSEIRWHKDVGSGVAIEPEHDLHFLANMTGESN